MKDFILRAQVCRIQVCRIINTLNLLINMTVDDYDEFLVERRKQMAVMIEKYYKEL